MRYLFKHTALFITAVVLCTFYTHAQSSDTAGVGFKNSGLLQPADIYLAGERHDIEEKFISQFNMIKYLHDHAGVDIIVFEYSYSFQVLLDRYFNSGDTSVLKNAIYREASTEADSEPKFNFFEKLYKYNRKLPQDDQLILACIDREALIAPGLEICSSLFDRTQASQGLLSILDAINPSGQIIDWDTRDSLVQVLSAYVEANEKKVKRSQENYHDIITILNGYNLGSKTRDEFFYDHIQELSQQFPDKSIFGQFGDKHIDYQERQKNLGAKLRANKNIRCKNISYFYQEIHDEKDLYNGNESVLDECFLEIDERVCDTLKALSLRKPSLIKTDSLKGLKKQYNFLMVHPVGHIRNQYR